MKILNIRKGFATNSSSSHSILELPRVNDIKEEFEGDFGWQFFTLKNKETKAQYLQSCLFISMSHIIGKEKTMEYFKKEYNTPFTQMGNEQYYDHPMVDHQSELTIPSNWNKTNVNEDFLKDFENYLSKENVVILGGNDNDEQQHGLYDKEKEVLSQYPKEQNAHDWVAKKNHDDWVLFNRINGTKIKLNFHQGEIKEKGQTPELADIKITDFCPYACDFCYQDSTLNGKHAKLEDIAFMAKELGKKQVFEVALGGGETTLHPQFKEIVKLFNDEHIVVNFTTKNLNFFKQNIAGEILPMTGAIAFSVTSTKEIEQVLNSLQNSNYDEVVDYGAYAYKKNRINFQYVMGSTNIKDFKKIMTMIEKENLKITLLGFKDNGRGETFCPENYQDWLNIVKNTQAKVSIDTALAAEFEKDLLQENVKKETFHVKEGGYSLYIDAVKNKFYPSSYAGLEQEFEFNQDWLGHWSTMLVKPEAPKKRIKIAIK